MILYIYMLPDLGKLYEKWHDTTLRVLYHLLELYACSERVRSIVTGIVLWGSVIAASVLLYFALTHWVPASKKMLDFTAKDYNTPEEIASQPPLTSQLVEPIPVEKDINY